MRDKIIKVYSSNGTLIASFDGDIADTPENQKEKIYNPHVSIDEDNSTATFEVFKDSNVWRTISSESEIYEIDGRRYFIYGEPSQISDDNLIRVTLKEIWNELDTKYVQAYNVEGSLEYLAEYTVSLVPFGSYPLVVNGATKTNPFARDNLGYYIWSILQDTGYSITHCDVVDDTYDEVNLLSAYQLETEGLSVLENLKQLKELTDCIFKWNTINKTLAVYDRNLANSEQNKWQGYEIREGVNLKSIEKRKNTNITTRVIPYGSDNLTIASVNSGVLYLSDTSYSNKIYTKIINNPDVESPQVLKSWATKELTKMCRPTVEYEVDFIKRNDGEYAAETFNLYDIVRIIYFDKELGAEVVDDQRIISLNYDVWKNSAFIANLGDKTLRWEQKLKQAIQDGKKSGEVISSSGIISAGNVVYGRGISKRRIDTVIAEIDAKADENGAYVNLLALYANDTQGIKSAPTDTDKTLWDTLYTYYAVNSKTYYKFNSTITKPDWEETKPINSSIASISAKADANEASISSLTEWQSGGKNKFDISKVVDNEYVTNHQTYLSVTTPLDSTGIHAGTPNKLKDYAPDLIVGETYTFSFITTSIKKYIYLLESNITWSIGESRIITQLMLDSTVYFYVDVLGGTADISEIQIELGSSVTSYQAYVEGVQRSLTNVIQKADANGASIGLLVDSNGVKGSVLVESINGQSAVKINADKINLTGYVTVSSLGDGGTTEIDGSRIKTGAIQSATYAYTSGNYSTDGMQISLDGAGYIRSKNFAIDSGGNAYFKGDIDGSQIKTGTIKSNNYLSLIIEGANPNQKNTLPWNLNYIYHVSDEEYAEEIGYYSYNSSLLDWLQYGNLDDIPDSSFSFSGTKISLETGTIESKNFAVNSDGNVFIKGEIEASNTVTSGEYTWTNKISLQDGMIKINTPVKYDGMHTYIPLFEFVYNGTKKYIVVDYYNNTNWYIYVAGGSFNNPIV